MKITDQRDKIMSSFFYFLTVKKANIYFLFLKLLHFSDTYEFYQKVSCSLGWRHWRLREVAQRGRFFVKLHFRPLKVKFLKKLKKYMQKFSQFYAIYQHIVQFNHTIWKLDCFEKVSSNSCPTRQKQNSRICGQRFVIIYALDQKKNQPTIRSENIHVLLLPHDRVAQQTRSYQLSQSQLTIAETYLHECPD